MRRVALAAFAVLSCVVLVGHSRLAGHLPLPNLTTSRAHLVELVLAAALVALASLPRLGAFLRGEGTTHGSIFASFRAAHPLLKLSLSAFLLIAMVGAVELVSFLYIRLTWGGPYMKQRISGYRVFKESPRFGYTPIDAAPGELETTDRFGFFCDHEVALAKKPGTLRVFVTGGSAMAGNGQNVGLGYEQVHEYPHGMFAYRKRIAGALRDRLQALNPGVEVEVVDAAYNQKCLHQSLVQYLESISRFHPDYVVSMDGFNDVFAFTLDGDEDAWEWWEKRFLPQFLELDDQERGKASCSKTALLATRAFMKRRQGRTVRTLESVSSAPESDDALRAEYDARRATLVAHARRWLQTFRHYAAVMREDDVRLVFAIQPMVSRRANKKLSTIEQGFAALDRPRASQPADDGYLVLRFFFDDFLSPELKKLTEERGGISVDLAGGLAPLDESVELYTDYCHLTERGNQVVAGLFADAIQRDLEARRKR